MKMRITRRAAGVLIAFMMIAVPASAAILTQNFMRTDVTVSACFTKTPGSDDGVAGAGVTNNSIAGAGVDLRQETLTVPAYIGDRSTYTDLVHFENTCGYDLNLDLVVEADFAGNGPIIGSWTGVYMEVWVANKNVPTTPVGDPADWVGPITIDEGTPGGAISVALPDASDFPLAVVVEADTATAVAGAYTVHWTAEATP